MINAVTIYKDSEDQPLVIDLRKPEESGFLVRSITGIGPTRATINMTEMALMDGARFNSARNESRNIVFDFAYYGINIEAIRQLSYKYFKTKGEIRIVFATDTRACEVRGYVESNEQTIFSSQAGALVSVQCPSAYLQALNLQTTVFNAIAPRFEFPFSNESLTEKLIIFSELETDLVKSVVYSGDAETGIVIRIHAIGDISTNIEIYNAETLEKITIDMAKILALTGANLGLADTVVISTIVGDKYAILLRDGVQTNILNCLDKYPDWFLIHKGDNLFTYYTEEGLAFIQMTIENPILYEGV